jgi:hypothetical protein
MPHKELRQKLDHIHVTLDGCVPGRASARVILIYHLWGAHVPWHPIMHTFFGFPCYGFVGSFGFVFSMIFCAFLVQLVFFRVFFSFAFFLENYEHFQILIFLQNY